MSHSTTTPAPITPEGSANGTGPPLLGASVPESAAMGEDQIRALIRERDQLRLELAKTAAQRDMYLKSCYALMRPELEAVDFDKEELLKQVGHGPSLRELIEELKNAPE